MSGDIHAQTPVLPKTLQLLGAELELSQENLMASGAIIRYAPSGDTPRSHTLLFTLRFFRGESLDPRASVQAKIEEVTARRPNDPVASATVVQTPDGGSYIVDATTWDGAVLRHDVFRYFKTPRGLAGFQIARRIALASDRPEAVNAALDEVAARRQAVVTEIMRDELVSLLDRL